MEYTKISVLKEMLTLQYFYKTDECLKINELHVYFKLGKELQNKKKKDIYEWELLHWKNKYSRENQQSQNFILWKNNTKKINKPPVKLNKEKEWKHK